MLPTAPPRGSLQGMAIIHHTTLVPSKIELLAAWLPAQPWYLHRGREPELTKIGGFRLDDPQGEVGIEFMVAADGIRGPGCHLPHSDDLPFACARRCQGWADRDC